jgi:ornithine decarboxylase
MSNKLYKYDVSSLRHIGKTYEPVVKKLAPIASLVEEYCRLQKEDKNFDAFYIMDLSRIARQYLQWVDHLPRCEPFYAIKCNSQTPMIKTVGALGCGFDCASTAEMKAVLELDGVDSTFMEEKVIFANPCKQISHILYAKKCNVKMTTADSEEELIKLATYYPECKVVLRIRTDDSKSVCQFSTKYGAYVDAMSELIGHCVDLKLNLVGISFHVGSGCMDIGSFESALRDVSKCFKIAASHGLHLKLLDIGGGFPGNENAKPSFTDIAGKISVIIDDLFPKDVRVIGEPGRYFAAGAYTLVTNVFGRKKGIPDSMLQKDDKQEYLYYVNDGIYQSFNCLFFDHHKITKDNTKYLVLDRKVETEEFKTKIFGPTCDALDTISTELTFPKLAVGDWIYFPEFGAYTIAAASAFNGFLTTKIYFVWLE